MDRLKFPVTECPHCGGKSIQIKQHISGDGTYYVDLETGEIDSSSLHDNLNYRNRGQYAICTDCGKRLFKVDNELNVIK